MSFFPVPENEEGRLISLQSYEVMDTPIDIDIDEITTLASEICQTPIALVSLLDGDRQWFKSHIGLAARETPKEQAFCAHAIVTPHQILQVDDARKDSRFQNNPLVTGDPKIVFYAGVPLVNDEGFALGTLCVIDRKPRQLTPDQINSLNILAKQVLIQLEYKKKVIELQKANSVLQEANSFIRNFALTAAHDIKNPLTSILISSELLKKHIGNSDLKGAKLAENGISSAKKLLDLVNSMLEYSLKPELLRSSKEEFGLNSLLEKIMGMIAPDKQVKLVMPEQDHQLLTSTIAMEQVFLNLFTNAIRYNDKAEVQIDVNFSATDRQYHFQVSDNGIGIEPHQLERIFEKHTTLGITDRFDQQGTGIGLASVKGLVEKLGGSIYVESELGKGSKFHVIIEK